MSVGQGFLNLDDKNYWIDNTLLVIIVFLVCCALFFGFAPLNFKQNVWQQSNYVYFGLSISCFTLAVLVHYRFFTH